MSRTGTWAWGWVVVVAAALGAAGAVRAQGPVKGSDGKVTMRLISERSAIVPGETNWIGIQCDIERDWHIYWNGLNDTGAPPTMTPKLPEGYSAGEMLWPAPVRHIADGGLLDHVYEKRVVFLLPVKAPSDAKPDSKVTLRVAGDWMVCKSACMVGSAEASITLPVGSPGSKPEKTADAKWFDAARDRLPKPAPADGSAITTAWKGSALTVTSHKGKRVAFYPMEGSAKPDNLLKGGASDSGQLELTFEKPGHVLGVVEVLTPESAGVRPMLWLIDVPDPGAKAGNEGPSKPDKAH